MNIPVYVINLDKDKQRWRSIRSKLMEHQIRPVRVNGIYGKNLSDTEVKEKTSRTIYQFGSRSLVGCALSHIKAWKKIYNNGHEYALVLEDDIIIKSNSLIDDLHHLVNNYIPDDFDICYLGCHGKCNSNYKYDMFEHYLRVYQVVHQEKKINDRVFIPQVASGAYGYLVSRQGVQKLLQLIKKVEHPIDMQMSLNFDKLNVYAINPILIDYNYEPDSNMLDSRSFLKSFNIHISDQKYSLQNILFYSQYQIFGYPLTLWMLILITISFSSGLLLTNNYLLYLLPLYAIISEPNYLLGDLTIIILSFVSARIMLSKLKL